ncbi:MAG TPA: hypothetical protein VGR82_05280, partial [Methylomirabilota bacterium]|nr:hypothetical protein [Methylomirabilota bacterium]
WAGLGAAGGLGTWGLPVALPSLAGCAMALRRRLGDRRGRVALVAAAGFVAGAAPFLVYNVTHPGVSLLRLGGRVMGVSATDVSGASSKAALAADVGARYLRGRVTFLAALPGDVLGALGPLPLVIVTLAVALACVALLAWRRGPAPTASSSACGWRLIGWSAVALLVFVLALDLGEPRHLVPAHLLLALALGGLWARATPSSRRLGGVALAAWMALNLVATLDEAAHASPSAVPLAAALQARHLVAVYTDYNVAYPVMWESRDRILASPAAGPVNVDRRPGVSRRVEAVMRPGYVFAAASEAGAIFAREATRIGVPWSHERVGAFDVFLPGRHVRPAELRLVRLFAVDSASSAR